MVLSKSEIALYAFATGRVLPKGTTRKAFRKAIQVLTPVAARAVPPVASVATNPFVAGGALGLGALATPQGQELLAMAEESGRANRIRFEQALTDLQYRSPRSKTSQTRTDGKKRINPFNQAIKKGMSIAKNSTSYGKKGTINNAKKAFAAVTKTASGASKGRKAPKSGIKRKMHLAMRKILGKKKPVRRTQKKSRIDIKVYKK